MANPPHSPLAERVKAVMHVVNELADRTGRKVMFAFNISDQLDRMLEHHDTVVAAGGTCVMVSLNSVGLAAVDYLRRRASLPIHGHRNGWGMFTRHPALGMEFTAYQKLWRLAGVDQLHVNGLKNKFCEPDESVVRSIKACLTPMFGGYTVMPVVSSGQWGGQAPETYRQTQTLDLMYLAGGGILAHPERPGGRRRGVAASLGSGGGGHRARRLRPRRTPNCGSRSSSTADWSTRSDAAGLLRRRLHRLDRRARSAHHERRPDGAVHRAAHAKKCWRDFRNVRAIGIAGNSRTMSPAEMDAALPAAFESLLARSPAIRALQSLLDVRFVAADRQHWPGDRDWPADLSESRRAAGRRRAESAAILRVWQSVRPLRASTAPSTASTAIRR